MWGNILKGFKRRKSKVPRGKASVTLRSVWKLSRRLLSSSKILIHADING